MASVNANADPTQLSSARTKRRYEDEVGTFCTSIRDPDCKQITDSASKRSRMGHIDLTSENEVERAFFPYGRYSGSCQQADSESSVEEMLRAILAVHHKTQADICTSRKKATELENVLASAEDDFEERVMKRHSDYMSAITYQALDFTTGICNICGKLVPENCKFYIMEKCGAVSTRCMHAVVDLLNTSAACV